MQEKGLRRVGGQTLAEKETSRAEARSRTPTTVYRNL